MKIINTCNINYFLPKIRKQIVSFAISRVLNQTRRISSIKYNDVSNAEEFKSTVALKVVANMNSTSKLLSQVSANLNSTKDAKTIFGGVHFPDNLFILKRYCIEAGLQTALLLNCSRYKNPAALRIFYSDVQQSDSQNICIASDGYVNFVVLDKENKNNSYQCCSSLKYLKLELDNFGNFQDQTKQRFLDMKQIGLWNLEFVFQPDLKNGTEAASLTQEIECILKRLNIISLKTEGSLIVDANISTKGMDQDTGIKTNIKNITRLGFIEEYIDFQIEQQRKQFSRLKYINQESSSMFSALLEDSELIQDYHCVNEKDTSQKFVDKASFLSCNNLNTDNLQKGLPEHPEVERSNLIEVYKLPLNIANELVKYESLSKAFESIHSFVKNKCLIYNFLLNNVQSKLNSRKLSFNSCGISVQQLTEIIDLLQAKKISLETAEDILDMLFNGDQRSATEIVEYYNWYQIWEESDIEKLCTKVLYTHFKEAKRYKKTKRKQYLSILLMALSKVTNRASPKHVEEIFEKIISNFEGRKKVK